MSNMRFDDVVELALQLSPAEQARLMERLAIAVRHALITGDPPDDQPEIEPYWTFAELDAMMQVVPMTGAEIIAAGLAGSWADLDISDSTAWVNARKQQRKERLHW